VAVRNTPYVLRDDAATVLSLKREYRDSGKPEAIGVTESVDVFVGMIALGCERV
jgi:hypothetical protein